MIHTNVVTITKTGNKSGDKFEVNILDVNAVTYVSYVTKAEFEIMDLISEMAVTIDHTIIDQLFSAIDGYGDDRYSEGFDAGEYESNY